jgi:hypothetical protein
MSDIENKQERFFGTYFDRDSVLRLSHWAEIVAWVVLTLYIIVWVFSLLLFVSQVASGIAFGKGMGILGVFSLFQPFLTQPIPGILAFFGLQAVSKGMLILLDMEDNSRRAARK